MSTTQPQPIPTAWSVLRVPSYRHLWVGGVVAGVGAVIQEVTAGWLMTSMTASPIPVGLLQTAGSLPVVVLALAAGAVADSVNRRRLMVALQGLLGLIATGLGLVTLGGGLTPELLLGAVTLAACANAFFTPAWMRTVPDVLPGPQIPSGVILNSTAVNLSRVLGGLAAGLLIAGATAGSGFLLNAVLASVLATVIALWEGPSKRSQLPGEQVLGALRAGLRYIRHSPPHRAVYLRTFVFILGGSAIPALLPVFARRELHLEGLGFGLVTAIFGLGAMAGATLLNQLRARASAETIVTGMSMVLGAAAVLLATSRGAATAFPALLAGGGAWVSMVATFGVSTGSASPSWVLSRSLSVYMLIFQGGAAVGGILWGQVAATMGVRAALLGAGVFLAAGLGARYLAAMPEANPHQLAPSQHWPSPSAGRPPSENGAVLVTVEYRINPAKAREFESAVTIASEERLRDGAFQWGLYADPARPECYLETFYVENWLEHLRQHERVTYADQRNEAAARAFHTGPEPPRVSHYIARHR